MWLWLRVLRYVYLFCNDGAGKIGYFFFCEGEEEESTRVESKTLFRIGELMMMVESPRNI